MKRKKPFGRVVEEGVMASLAMAGCRLSHNLELDLHQKVDFVIHGFGEGTEPVAIGIQVTLREDLVKFRVAKLCALRVVSRLFIVVPKRAELACRPSLQFGQDLKRLLSNLAREESHRAMVVVIGDAVNINPI